MTQASSSSVYQSLLSARSRRLRTIGLLLLAAVIGMTLWGGLSLMPSLRASSRAAHRAVFSRTHRGETAATAATMRAPEQRAADERERKALLAKVIFAYAYWTVCGLLVLGLLGVAWLDFREVLRNYSARRRKLWMEAIDRAQQGQNFRNGSPED